MKKVKKRWWNRPFRKHGDEARAIRELGRIFGVPVHLLDKKSWCAGMSHGEDYGVEVYLRDPNTGRKESLREIFSTACHEIGHILLTRRNKFPYYAKEQADPKKMSRKALQAVCRTGFRAECYVEKIGEELLNLFFPDIPFSRGYHPGNEKERKWLYNNYLNQYGDELKRRNKRRIL